MSSGDSCCSRMCSLAFFLRLFPLRTHGIAIAALSTLVGTVGVLVVVAAIASNAAAAASASARGDAAAGAGTQCGYSSSDLVSVSPTAAQNTQTNPFDITERSTYRAGQTSGP